VEVQALFKLAEVRHAYSHFKVHLHVFVCRGRGRLRSVRPHAWVAAGELSEYPFPGANHKFFLQLREQLRKKLI
jgi:A/G-specific adenine glycosylase